jgi:hypothetical protein
MPKDSVDIEDMAGFFGDGRIPGDEVSHIDQLKKFLKKARSKEARLHPMRFNGG